MEVPLAIKISGFIIPLLFGGYCLANALDAFIGGTGEAFVKNLIGSFIGFMLAFVVFGYAIARYVAP